MVTTPRDHPNQAAKRLRTAPTASHRRRRGSIGGWMFIALILAGTVGVGSFVASEFSFFGGSDESLNAATYRVVRESLALTIVEDGNVESSSNVDVKCEIAGGATILWIVEDGKEVQEGDVIVRLDQSILDDQFNAQRIVYERAVAARIQAEENYEAAKLSVDEYVKGMFIKELQDFEAQITIAMENLRSSQNVLQHTEKMMRKGFATPLQLEADQFAVQRSELELKSAKKAKEVLVEFTRLKTTKTLEAARDAMAAQKRSEQAACELEKVRLDRLQGQLKDCVIKAPANGMVVWANETGRRRSSQQTPSVEEGALIREQQTIIRLPDLTSMQVKVTVHESSVDQLKIGMPARIRILNRELNGRVVAIANQPEPGSWYSSAVKQYAATVEIEGKPTSLKPGMTAEVEILVAELDNVLTVPVQVVVEQNDKFYGWVQKPDGPERRPLILGLTNDKMIEIRDGLSEGELVILNPRALIAEAREDNAEIQDTENRDKSPSSSPDRKQGDRQPKQSSPAGQPKKSDAAAAGKPQTAGAG